MRHITRCIAAILAGALLLGGGFAISAQKGIPIKIGKDAFGFHVPVDLLDKTVYGNFPDEHLMFMVDDALDGLKSPKNILVLNVPRLKNGFALVEKGRRGQKKRIILFDEEEFERFKLDPKLLLPNADRTNYFLSLLTLAHEIGHHVCEHLTDNTNSLKEQELEADRVAGAILSKSQWREFFEATLDDFLSAGRKVLGKAEGSQTHPPLESRLEAIRYGWEHGPGCAAALKRSPARSGSKRKE